MSAVIVRETGVPRLSVDCIDVAHSRARVGFNVQFLTGLGMQRFSHPCRHAARAVAADLGDGAVGIVKANAAGVRARPYEELDAIRADSGVARAEASREF